MILNGRRIFSDSLFVRRGSFLCTYVSVPGFMFRLELGQTDDMMIYDYLLILLGYCLDIHDVGYVGLISYVVC